jgi:LysM repeat protein
MSTTHTAQSQHSRRTRTDPAMRMADTRRLGRLSLLEIVVLFVIAGLLVVGVLRTQPSGESMHATQTVQVHTGQTLWAIARAHPIDGLSTAQTAELISRNNHLSGGLLSAGQTLQVPAGGSAGPQMASR